MPHPIMFHDDDQGLAELRSIALDFPDAFEKVSWGRPVFCAPKMFAMYGGNVKSTEGMVPYPYSLLIKVDDSDRRARWNRTSGSSSRPIWGPSAGWDWISQRPKWIGTR